MGRVPERARVILVGWVIALALAFLLARSEARHEARWTPRGQGPDAWRFIELVWQALSGPIWHPMKAVGEEDSHDWTCEWTFAVVLLAGMAAYPCRPNFWTGLVSTFAMILLVLGFIFHYWTPELWVAVVLLAGMAAHPCRPNFWTGLVSALAMIVWFLVGFVAIIAG